MKYLCIAALAWAPLLLACSKSAPAPKLPTGQGCSEISFIPVSGHSLSSAEVRTANSLFASNNIDSRHFRYTRYARELVQTYFPPYASFDEQMVSVEEYTNGLRVFTGQSNFLFKNGVFSSRAGEPTGGTSLGTSAQLKAGQLRGLFVATITKFDAARLGEVQRQCVSAEFGYYDLNAGTSNAPENLVRAWRVSIKNQAYPFAYYQDGEGQLIYYDNGVRSFR
ncbi:hypothetical protein [uncultured Hymenobacter sp.]|uniref:hypothetical protein n=1 Tax=uncultured Hymenobacter sp. TaxID=170016 RepID=UPI0035CB4CC6